ncbi:MAG: hypothetical protein IKR59_06705, partial [Lachnospiraceae bacterium]|nr:hypothetical protein [Lachnospiraceae bacterium]
SVRITGVTQDTAEDGLENVTFGPAAVSTVVNDNGTSSKVSLKADVSDIVEGKSITYTASIGSAPKNSIQVFLSNGKTITIYSGQKSGSLKVDARKDDFYKQGKETLTLKITGITQDSAQDGLESVSYDSSAVRTTVSDDEDEAKVTLHVDKIAAFEGTELTYTAEIDNAPKGILIVTLDNGKTIMIKAGKTCGTLKTKIRKDDVYKQGDETLEVKIKKVSPDSTKDGLEKITFDTKAVSTKIYDDDDASKVTLSVDQENAVEGEKLTYTAEIDNAPKSDVTVTLDNGETITIKADETSGTVTVDTREDDAYKQGDETVEAKITKVIQDSAKDGLEKVTFDNTAVKTTVKDDESISTVTLSVDKESAKEGETLTYTAEIDKAPKSDVTVTLDNGETITIKADEASGTVTVDTREDDLYKQDDETLTVQITAVTPDNAEDGLENVAFDDASVSTVVADDSDVSTVKVKVCQSEETEDGKWICTAEVDHAPQTDLTLIMSGSVEITIGAGKTNGTSEPFVYDPSVEIVLTEYQGGGYEKLVVEIIIINPPVLAEAEIAVDEALLKDGNAVNAGGHETLGTGSFTVNLYGEETGTVQIGGEGGCTVTLHNGADADISDAAVTVNGVKFNVTGVSQSGDNYTIYYSYELTGAQTHSDPEKVGENDTLKGSLDILLTNESGDTAKSTLLVLVYDDGPKVTIIEDASVNLIVDEADLDDGKIEHAAVTSEIVDAGSLFDVLPGADGESDRTYELSLFENGTVSGVIYKRNNDRHVVTDDDDSLVPESVIDECALKALYAGKVYDVILIKNENGTISGMIEFSQENEDTEQVEIFRVSIDGEGQVQLTEYRHLEVDGGASIYHVVEQTDDQGGTTETKVDVISLENMIAVTLTSQDNDGDTAAASVPVSLIFRDDEE